MILSISTLQLGYDPTMKHEEQRRVLFESNCHAQIFHSWKENVLLHVFMFYKHKRSIAHDSKLRVSAAADWATWKQSRSMFGL